MKFCGRESEIRQLADDASEGRFAVVVSRAGLGATALLTRGAAPALRAAGFITVCYSDWQGRSFPTQLKETVAQAVRDQADDGFFAQSESLEEMLTRIRGVTQRRVALLLDQFEEYLRFHNATDIADEFDAELAQAVNSRDGHVIVALHEHALEGFDRLSHLIPNLLGHSLRLTPLTRATAQCVVRSLAEEECIPIDDSVVDSLADATAARVDGGVHVWLLVQGVTRLLAAAAARKPAAATAPVLEALGGADVLILESLDPEIDKLNRSHKEVLFRWCEVLISSRDNHRLAATESALAERASGLARFGTTLLPILIGNGMLRVVHSAGMSRYELSRESLTIVLKDWWNRQEAAMAARQRAQFRVRSMTIAAGAIVALYVVWLWMNWK